MTDLPRIALLPGKHKRAKQGHPWIYANEVAMTPEVKSLPAGTLVSVDNSGGEPMGTAFCTPQTLVVARMLDRRPNCPFAAAFVAERVERALALRSKLFAEPYYRLIHAEADGLPGLIVDRFGEGLVCQLNTAGLELHRDAVLEGLQQVLEPAWLLLRNDSSQRALERLPSLVESLLGEPPSPLEITENDTVYLADVAGGQKTGWFFDQRLNRAMVAELAAGARVLDAYCYLGGFGLLAAKAGARHVTLLDSSASALELATAAAARNGLSEVVTAQQSDVFEAFEAYAKEKRQFEVVVIDPPAFARSKKDLPAALRGYRKLARLAARAVAPGGFLLANSCSHTVDAASFLQETSRGVQEAGRNARILRATGASPDHPTHPHLPESAYLKALLLHLD